MGSRTADKLKEIEELRGSLAVKLGEIERRVPLAGFGKKIAMVLGGSSAASGMLAFAFRRFRGGGKKKKAKRGKGEAPVVQPTSVTVNASVLPKGAAYLAAAGFAAWAGLKVYDAVKKRNGDASSGFRPSVVTPMPESERRSGT